jgi:hypothetical protein
MHPFFVICIGVIVVAVLVWMLWGSRAPAEASASADGELLDPNDSYQMGLLAGLMGGDVVDAAVYQFALRRFEEIHGRKANTRDIGTVAGLMSENQSSVTSRTIGPE